MTREEIIRMAREAGLHLPYWGEDQDPKKDPPRWTMVSPLPPLLERFAALVAAAEREACAKVCEDLMAPPRVGGIDNAVLYHDATEDCAAAIRARSKT
jgi:hypothetical protein